MQNAATRDLAASLWKASQISIRTPQMAYSSNFLEAMLRSCDRFADGDRRTGIHLASADTGVGKTLGYAIPLLAYASVSRHRVAIATHSHALMRQMKEGDLAFINELLIKCGRDPLKIERRIGQQAYISASATASLIADLGSENKDVAEQLRPFLDFALDSNEGKNSGLIEDAIHDFGELPSNIQSLICLDPNSPKTDRKMYDHQRGLAAEADVVLVTHHYLSAVSLFQGGDNDYTMLVIDEADHISSAIASISTYDLAFRRLARLLASYGHKAASLAAGALGDSIASIGHANQSKQAIALHQLPARSREQIFAGAGALLEALVVVGKRYKKSALHTEVHQEIERARFILAELVAQGLSSNARFWSVALSFSPSRRYPSISMMPLYPARQIAKLWASSETRGEKIVCAFLTSATLGEPGRSDPEKAFSEICGQIGLKKDNQHQVAVPELWGQYEPENFGKMAFVLPDPTIEDPVDGVEEESGETILNEKCSRYAAEMTVAAHNAGGRTLILVPSYKDVEKLSELLNIKSLIIQKPGNYAECLRRFKEDSRAVWLSPTSWSGLNLPGMIDNLVIPRIPFGSQNELRKALLTGIAKMEEEKVEHILRMERRLNCKRKLRQGMGRGIRKADDKVRVWIGDPRFPIEWSAQDLLSGKNICRDYRHHKFVLDAIPERFKKGLHQANKPQRVFWNP